jgi:hypothetical protein
VTSTAQIPFSKDSLDKAKNLTRNKGSRQELCGRQKGAYMNNVIIVIFVCIISNVPLSTYSTKTSSPTTKDLQALAYLLGLSGTKYKS